MKKILLLSALLVLLGIDFMAFRAVESGDESFVMYGWLVLLFSTVLYAIFTLQFLSKKK